MSLYQRLLKIVAGHLPARHRAVFVAKEVGITVYRLREWKRRGIPKARAERVSELTGGKISVKEIVAAWEIYALGKGRKGRKPTKPYEPLPPIPNNSITANEFYVCGPAYDGRRVKSPKKKSWWEQEGVIHVDD